jgi:hypothetical protein
LGCSGSGAYWLRCAIAIAIVGRWSPGILRRTVDEATRQRPQGGLRLRARLKGRMQASSARSGQRLVQREPGPGALARARDGVTDSSASKGRGHGRNSGERFCGRPGENDAQTMYRGERNVNRDRRGGPSVGPRDPASVTGKESPRKGNLLGMSFPGEKAHCELRRCLSSAL